MKLGSSVLPSSETFRANRVAHLAALETVREAAMRAAAGGGAEATARHVARGKMAVPPRAAPSLQPNTPRSHDWVNPDPALRTARSST